MTTFIFVFIILVLLVLLASSVGIAIMADITDHPRLAFGGIVLACGTFAIITAIIGLAVKGLILFT